MVAPLAFELKEKIDLAKENYRFVRVVERGSGEQARLRLFDDMEYHPVSYTHLNGENSVGTSL